MPHPLLDRLDELRRRSRRAGIARGAALCVIAAAAGIAAAALLDAALRPASHVVRLIVTIAAAAPFVWAVASKLLPPLREAPSDVDLARQIERRDPSWRGRLAAAVGFLTSAPPGSPAIREHVVNAATEQVAGRPLPDLVEPARVRRPVFGAGAALLAATVVAVGLPSWTATAVARLSMPFAEIEWPRAVDLVLLTETGEPIGRQIRVGRGQTLRFTVKNLRGDVPEDLSLELVPPRGGRRTEPIPSAEEGPARRIGLGSLFAAEGPLRFRAVGGDHRDMPFVTAEVVPPPVFERIEVTVAPPAYLDQPPTILPKGTGDVAAPIGSTVTVKARANKPLAAAELRIGGAAGPPATLSDDGRSLTAAFPLTEPVVSSWWFKLRDRSGFENPEPTRYELRVTADEVPKVSLAEPPEDLRATAAADLPVVLEASDDHGLTSARLRFVAGGPAFGDDSADSENEGRGQTIRLFDGPDRPKSGMWPLVWSLGPLGLVPGDRLSFRGEAADAFDLGPPHVGLSPPRTVTIVSAAEKREELLGRQADLLADLSQARRDEERLRGSIDTLLSHLAAGSPRPEDRDLLARAEAEQRRLAAKLGDPKQGAESRAARAAAELRANRIDDPDLDDRLGRIASELSSLRSDALAAADRDLTASRKAAPDEAQAPLASVRGHLDVVIGGLDSLLRDLGGWQSRRDVDAEISDLLANQREISEETAVAAAQTLGAAAGQISEGQAAALERLGMRQAGLADRLARLGTTLDQLAAGGPRGDEPSGEQPAPPDPAARAAADTLRDAGLPTAARAAGESIRANDLGEAGRLQREVAAKLREARAALATADPRSSDAESLRKEAERLADLAADQKDVAETLRKAAESRDGLSPADRDPLLREQSRLREETAAAARRLRDAGSTSAESALHDAASHMADALERLTRREDDEAAREAREAADRLEQARQEAARAAEGMNDRLADELRETSAAAVAALATRQQAANEEMARLEVLKAASGRLSRSQLRSLRQLADTQKALAGETAALAETLKPAPAVAHALSSAAERMTAAADALGRGETGDEPQRHGRAAKQRLDHVAAALKPPNSQGDAPQENATTEDQPPGGSPGEVVSLLAQLELLKNLQEDLLQRTTEADDREPSPARDAELDRLAAEQRSLAELLQQLVRSAAGDAEP